MTEASEDKASARKAATSRLAAKRAAKAAAKAAKKGTTPIGLEQVAESVDTASSWVTEHQRALWGGTAAIALAGIVWLTFSGHLSKQGRESAELLREGLSALTAPVVGPEDTALEDVDETFASREERAKEAQKRLAKVSERFPKAPAAAWSELARGKALSALGKHAEAQKAYAAAQGAAGDDPYLRWRTLEALGFSLEAQKKYAEAEKRFAELEGLGEPHVALGQYHRARMLAAQDKPKEAAKLLESLIAAQREAVDSNALPSIVTDAELLLASLGGGTAPPKLRADLPAPVAGPTGEAAAQGEGLTQQIVDSLRKQLENPEQVQKGLTPEMIQELQQKVDEGQTTGTVIKVPTGETPAPPGATPAPKPEAAPTEAPKPAPEPAAKPAPAPKAAPKPAAKPEAAPAAAPKPAAPAEAAPAPATPAPEPEPAKPAAPPAAEPAPAAPEGEAP